MIAAVTLDMVGSRALADRPAAQRALDAAIARVERDLPLASIPLHPTVGDEQQGEYPTIETALAGLLLLQLTLPEGLECRFGIGLGSSSVIPSAGGDLPDGPAWWAARAAIEHVHELQQRVAPHARTWVAGSGEEPADASAIAVTNAYLLARDELVQSMSDRARRLAYGRCLDRTQKRLAADEGITPSAVSQLLTSAGARAVVAGFRLLREEIS